MSKSVHLFIALALMLFAATFASAAQTGIMVEPLRVEVVDGKRYGQITVLNQSQDEPVVYSISKLAMRMNEDGTLYTPDVLSKRESIAQSMIRFSPRTANIPPGGRQVVRIAVRKPPNLPDGEYMSYIRVGPMGDPKAVKNANTDLPPDAAGITIAMRVGMRIPVIIYEGEPKVKTTLLGARLGVTEIGGPALEFKLKREGSYSSYVGLNAYAMINGKKELIASKPRVVTYLPQSTRTVLLPILNQSFTSGKILVEIHDYKDKAKKAIDSKEFFVK